MLGSNKWEMTCKLLKENKWFSDCYENNKPDGLAAYRIDLKVVGYKHKKKSA